MDAGKVVMTSLSIFFLIGSAVVALFTLVLLMAGGANAKPHEIRLLKIFIFTLLGLCVVALVGTILLLVYGRPGLSLIPAILPGVYCVTLVVWMWVTEF